MSKTKFTPAPWNVYVEDDCHGSQEYDQICIGMKSYIEDPYRHRCMDLIVIDGEPSDEEAMAKC